MKIEISKVTTGKPNILAMFQNDDHTITIKVLDDTSYEITRNGYTAKTDMTKWYYNGYGVIRHIENDIKAGYYGKMNRMG